MPWGIYGHWDATRNAMVIRDSREQENGLVGKEIGIITLAQLKALDDFHNGEIHEMYLEFHELEDKLQKLTNKFLNTLKAEIPPVGKGELKLTLPSGALVLPEKKLHLPGS